MGSSVLGLGAGSARGLPVALSVVHCQVPEISQASCEAPPTAPLSGGSSRRASFHSKTKSRKTVRITGNSESSENQSKGGDKGRSSKEFGELKFYGFITGNRITHSLSLTPPLFGGSWDFVRLCAWSLVHYLFGSVGCAATAERRRFVCLFVYEYLFACFEL